VREAAAKAAGRRCGDINEHSRPAGRDKRDGEREGGGGGREGGRGSRLPAAGQLRMLVVSRSRIINHRAER